MADDLTARLKLAVAHLKSGRLAEADAQCAAILTARPNHSDALEVRGLIAAQAGEFESAAAYFRAALQRAGRRSPATYSNLGEALVRLGRPQDAIAVLREALAVDPKYSIAAGKLAGLLAAAGNHEEALTIVRAGLAYSPEHAELNGVAAGLLISLARPAEAVPHLYIALEEAPEIDIHWSHLYRLLLIGCLPAERAGDLLCKALEHPRIRPTMIARSIATSLATSAHIATLISLMNRAGEPGGKTSANTINGLGRDRLLLALMTISPVPNSALERLFTRIRRELLAANDGPELISGALTFCVALANQAFLTDYAWECSDDEQRRVAQLIADFSPSAVDTTTLVRIACYRPLHELRNAGVLADRRWPDEIEPLIRMQIREPLAEIGLRAQIPSLTAVTDAISRRVQAQYDEHPYPRWVRAETMASTLLPSFIAELGGRVVVNDATFQAPDVLIAGCGTGQQVVTAASRYRNAKIVAIDISRASLAHAKRRSQLLGIDNVQFLQADILELGALENRFHVIESSGVLHHLADPMAGWRTLNELLRPGGLMNIGLYSELGRQSIVAAQAWIAQRGYEPVADHIRRCRAEILALAPEDPLAALRDSVDFYNLSSCRDLLFHAQEHRFTLAQIRIALDSLGLKFLRFDVPNASGYRLQFPDDPAMTSLDHWEAYERDHPTTFSGMYQMWLQKDRGSADSELTAFGERE